MKIRVLVLESNRLWGDGATNLLNAQPDITATLIRGISDDELAKGRALKPTIILVDSRSSVHGGLEAAHNLCIKFPKARVILMNVSAPQFDMERLLRTGVSGLILKDAPIDECLSTIRLVAKGKAVIPSRQTTSIFTSTVKRPPRIARSVCISRRERQVVLLISNGLSNQQIALELQLSIHTVKSHIHNVMVKLSLHSRLELARYILTGDDRRA
jgi:DNA-binding NarL/FixJ family response regulator